MKKNVYILGTGLSHNGSACLLKNGKIVVAIEKERLVRRKHAGGNDSLAIQYCLDCEGITMNDISLVVQNDVWSNLEYCNEYFKGGNRLFKDYRDIPLVSISHHLAHAYSAIGTCTWDNFSVLVIDGCGSTFDECIDLEGAMIPEKERIKPEIAHLFAEKDSYYHYEDGKVTPLYKDFSEFGFSLKNYNMHPPVTKHSIGGIYSAVSNYIFNDFDDHGKVMGLAPYGRPGKFNMEIFNLEDGRLKVNYDWMKCFQKPARTYQEMSSNFQYYADIAYWVQEELTRAVQYVVDHRIKIDNCKNLAYSGGVALNAVTNKSILLNTPISNIYIQPAAGDNGLAIGCAYYGWLEIHKGERIKHDKKTFFGISYSANDIKETLENYWVIPDEGIAKEIFSLFFSFIENFNKSMNGGIKDSSTIQFNIKGLDMYQVVVDGDKISIHNEYLRAPSCEINVDVEIFKKLVLNPSYCTNYCNRLEDQIRITNVAEFERFNKAVDLEGIAGALRKEIKDRKLGNKVNFEEANDYITETAKLLEKGNVVAWFQDKSEFGPRALGKRSILADPRLRGIRDFINANIKMREDFRPFAPSVPLEDQGRYFVYDYESPYMILVNEVKREWKNKIESVVHKNNTARVQTVTRDVTPKYYSLLKKFGEITGLPMLLNTSFNKRGMPIVETPEEALDFFYNSSLDYLVMDKFIVSK